MRYPSFQVIFAVLALPLAAGCGDPGPKVVEVRGTVTYAGKPVSQGRISFMPIDAANASIRPAIGVIEEDGSYVIRAFPNRDGAEPGDYLVSVLSYTGSFVEGTVVYLVPKRFSEAKSSGLKATVPGDRSTVMMNFDLSS